MYKRQLQEVDLLEELLLVVLERAHRTRRTARVRVSFGKVLGFGFAEPVVDPGLSTCR